MTPPSRRELLAGAAAACLPALRLDVAAAGGVPPDERPAGAVAADERFWRRVRAAYDLPPGVINLDNGNINPASRTVVRDLVRHAEALERAPVPHSHAVYRTVTLGVVQPGLAALLGVPADEVAFVRTATEALDTVLLGVPLAAGDEILCSTHDYFAMLDALEHRRRRDGVTLRVLRPPVPAPSLDALAAMYEAAIGPRTRLVLLTQPSNLTGQLLPVRRIADAAHRAGAEVVLDGAQSFALLPYTMAETGCDYFGASLHKWLGAPIGAGLLWMRPGLVEKVWPLVPPPATVTGMARFTWSGTYPEFVSAPAAAALAFHESIGTARKAERLRHLTAHWRSRAERLPGTRFYTAGDADASCGIATMEVEGMEPGVLQERLWTRHRILVQDMASGSRTPEIRGIRVTPNVYTTTEELDRFVEVLGREIRGA